MGLPIGGGFSPEGPPDPFGFGILDFVISIVNWILRVVAALFNYLVSVLISIVNALLTIFKSIGKFLLHVWDSYIKKGITWLASHVQKLRAWLKRTLKPVIDFFQKVKKWYDTHILPQQLRLLKMLQTIRRFLGILRVFHIKWASTLDNALADIQNRIEKSIAITRGILNQIINTLALVLDPTLLIFRNVLGGSLLSNLGAIKRIFGYGDNRILSASEQATIEKDHSLYFASTTAAYMKVPLSSGLSDDDKARIAVCRQALADATDSTIPT